MTVNFTDRPQFTLKEIIYVVGFVLAIGGTQAADAYNENVFKSEVREYISASTTNDQYQWKAINALTDDKKVDELTLRKLELDVTRILTELQQ